MGAGGDAEPEPETGQVAATRDWSELSLDAIASVFARLGPVEVLMGAGLVCRSWLRAAEEPSSLWKHLDMAACSHNAVKEKRRSGDADALRAMARKAMDRCAGQLEVFVGEEFVDDDLLKYIGGRAPSLKVLRLISCLHIRNEAFVEAISKFPLLEELNLSTCESIGGRATYEAVGKACQNLKQFVADKDFTTYGQFGHDEAYGIAAMRGLRFLKISCSELNNEAMDAILDNRPHLKSLDLINCYNVVMDGAMRAKCAGIKMCVDNSYVHMFYD